MTLPPLPTDPHDLFFNTPLYKQYEVDRKQCKRPAHNKVGWYYDPLDGFSGKLDVYCPACEKEATFFTGGGQYTPSPPTLNGGGTNPDQTSLPRIVERQFNCARGGHAMWVIHRGEGRVIQKIGQYPSLHELESHRVSHLRKHFPTDYPELNRALGLMTHGAGAGAFLYLRRVFERRVVAAARRVEASNSNFDMESWSEKRPDEKVNEIAEELPRMVVTNRAHLYRILSAGLHELTDAFCGEQFEVLFSAIIMILEAELAERIRKESESHLEKALQQANAKSAAAQRGDEPGSTFDK